MNRWRRWLRRRAETEAAGPEVYQRATAADVHNAFRLFLNRPPTAAEADYWIGLVERGAITLANLTDEFANGHEFRARQAERRGIERVVLPDFCLYVRRNDYLIGGAIARTGAYEPLVTAQVRARLGPGAVFVDVGANIGYFSLLAATLVGEAGRVVAFEPSAGNGDLIRRSLADNGFANVELHQKAVAERAGRFLLDEGGANSNARIVTASPDGYERPAVEAVALDEALADLARLDLVKLDIEGAEARAWAGMQGLIARFHPPLLFEYAPRAIRAVSGVAPEAFLAEVMARYSVRDVAEPARPLDAAAIAERLAASGSTHLDLLALPA